MKNFKGKFIGVDLDGTLAEYQSGDLSAGRRVTVGRPIPPMLRFVQHLIAEGFDVRIFTARLAKGYESEHSEHITAINKWCTKHIGRTLPITADKSRDMALLIDDRAIAIERNAGAVSLVTDLAKEFLGEEVTRNLQLLGVTELVVKRPLDDDELVQDILHGSEIEFIPINREGGNPQIDFPDSKPVNPDDVRKTVPEILHSMAETYEQRNKAYGGSYKTVGAILAACFPLGIKPGDEHHWNRVMCLIQVIGKIGRIVSNPEELHVDSPHDITVYSAMYQELIREARANR